MRMNYRYELSRASGRFGRMCERVLFAKKCCPQLEDKMAMFGKKDEN